MPAKALSILAGLAILGFVVMAARRNRVAAWAFLSVAVSAGLAFGVAVGQDVLGAGVTGAVVAGPVFAGAVVWFDWLNPRSGRLRGHDKD